MHKARLEELEETIGYRFRQPELLERALTHRSAAPDGTATEIRADNEQLEYLGDAVLGMLVSEYLVGMFPRWSEGQLSKSRARLVNAASLHTAARRLNLGEHLRLGKGEEKTGGREKPALLADAFEAMVAAIYLDAGLPESREFVKRALLDEAIDLEGSRLELSDHKSALQEFLQARGLPSPRYAVMRETGPDHRKIFWMQVDVPGLVNANGTGTNKKEAEQSAAAQALEMLRAAELKNENVRPRKG
jgi:ribonuclease III